MHAAAVSAEAPRHVFRVRERLTRPESIPASGSSAPKSKSLREQVADIALSATSIDDVYPALDEAFESEQFIALNNESFARSTDRDDQALAPSFDVFTLREQKFGARVARKLAMSDRIWVKVAQQMAAKTARQVRDHSQSPGSAPGRYVTECVCDPSFPLEFRELSLQVWRGLIANTALLALLQRGETHQLADCYADATLAGARAAIRWAALSTDDIIQMRKDQLEREDWLTGELQKVSSGEDGADASRPS